MSTRFQHVTTLNMAYCHIATLEVGAFDGMDALLELKLESNRLNYLHGSSLFPANVHHVEGGRRTHGRTDEEDELDRFSISFGVPIPLSSEAPRNR